MNLNKYKNVLISGAGELGSRYLQSIASCALPVTIYIHSNNTQSLDICQQRWAEVNGHTSYHQLVVCHTLNQLPTQLDLAIISSTAESRPVLVKEIAGRADVNYWLLEKILAQRASDINQMLSHVSASAQSWVNYYMQSEPWYAEIKKYLTPGTLKHMSVQGGEWGLACNALHFIHLHEWFSETSLVSLRSEGLLDRWHEGKRPGNWDIFGELVANFSDGGRLSLRAEPGSVGYSLLLQDGKYTWQIDEQTGIAERSDGFKVIGRVPYQSERKLVEQILTTGNCQLPTFKGVAEVDQLFISTMLNHWRLNENLAALVVPIT